VPEEGFKADTIKLPLTGLDVAMILGWYFYDSPWSNDADGFGSDDPIWF
jgi:hypothetical protein